MILLFAIMLRHCRRRNDIKPSYEPLYLKLKYNDIRNSLKNIKKLRLFEPEKILFDHSSKRGRGKRIIENFRIS